jgi:small subunit ribosomal protein S7
MMIDGKKACAEKQLYGALDIIEGKKPAVLVPGLKSSIELFRLAVENSKPMVEVKSRRVGGSNYQVPVEVRPERRTALAIRWLIEFARKRSGRSMMDNLSAELIDAAQKRGGTAKRKEEVHKMAEANKAFAHYRW